MDFGKFGKQNQPNSDRNSDQDSNQDSNQEPEVSEEELAKYLAEKKPEEQTAPRDEMIRVEPKSPNLEKPETPDQKPMPAAKESPTLETTNTTEIPEKNPPSATQPDQESELAAISQNEPKPISVSDNFLPPSAQKKPEPASPPTPVSWPPPQPLEKPPTPGKTEFYHTKQPVQKIEKPPKIKILFMIFLVIILMVGGAGAWWYFLATGNLTLSVTPTDAKIQVAGLASTQTATQTATANQTLKLKPGTYKISIQKENYVSCEKEVTIARLKTINFKLDLKKIPIVEQVSPERIDNFYLVNNEIIILGNNGKTLDKLVEPTTKSQAESKSAFDKKALTPDILTNITKIIWHPTESLAILKIIQDKDKLSSTPFANSNVADGKEMTWLYDFKRYDLVNQEATFWGADIGDLVWAPNGEKVYYYLAPAGGEKTIVSASKSNQNLERILNLKESGIENPQISISPDGKYLTLIPRSKNYNTNYVYLFEILTKKLTKLVSSGNNLEAKFSTDSKKVLYGTYSKNDQEPTDYSALSIIDVESKNKKELTVMAFLDEVSFTSDSQYLIVSIGTSKSESDKLNKINISNAEKSELVYESSKTITLKPTKILLSSANDIYFISSNYLYRVGLVGSKCE